MSVFQNGGLEVLLFPAFLGPGPISQHLVQSLLLISTPGMSILTMPSAAGVILDKGCDVFSDPNALICVQYT